MDGFLPHALIYLCAGVIAVPVANRLGLGSVLGYLAAGVIIGPVTGLVGAETSDLQHFAEFGVVMMLFLIGLELQPRKLWEMRHRLLGLGGLQVAVTAALVAVVAIGLGQPWQVALVVGMILSLSSTAIVLQTLGEKGWITTSGGQASFAVLLFQDVAVIPILAVMPLLALPELVGAHAPAADHAAGGLWIDTLPGWARAAAILAAVTAVVLAGRFVIRPALRFIAASRLGEIFTAAALLLVVAIALLMTLVGLSPALGSFLAGVVLADSEFRHELESDIAPFKGLLLGLFFITVGAGIQFEAMFADFGMILALVAGLMLLKAAVLFALAVMFRLRGRDRWLFALGLAQAGEFAFVLLSFALSNGVMPAQLAQTLSLVVAISMLLTPALFVLFEYVIAPRLAGRVDTREADEITETGVAVIAGVGRFGQVVNRLLLVNRFKTVVLDYEMDMIETLSRFKVRAFYGDASRPELLRSAGIDHAKVFVIAIDDRERALEMVRYVKRDFPQVTIIARAFDRVHLYELKQAGADVIVREVFRSALEAGVHALRALGVHPFKAEIASREFEKFDVATLEKLYELWNREVDVTDNQAYIDQSNLRMASLTEAMERDRRTFHDRTERGWTPPPTRRRDETASGGEADAPAGAR